MGDAQEPPSKRRRMPETDQQFMKIGVFTMAGETVQSLFVPSTILGRELLDMVLPAQAKHTTAVWQSFSMVYQPSISPCRLVHKGSPIVHG